MTDNVYTLKPSQKMLPLLTSVKSKPRLYYGNTEQHSLSASVRMRKEKETFTILSAAYHLRF